MISGHRRRVLFRVGHISRLSEFIMRSPLMFVHSCRSTCEGGSCSPFVSCQRRPKKWPTPCPSFHLVITILLQVDFLTIVSPTHVRLRHCLCPSHVFLPVHSLVDLLQIGAGTTATVSKSNCLQGPTQSGQAQLARLHWMMLTTCSTK